MIVTIPIIIFVLIFQRRIVAGLTSGAVKGYRGDPGQMAEITLDKVTKRFPDGTEAVKQLDLDRRRRVPDPRRPVGVRQVDRC